LYENQAHSVTGIGEKSATSQDYRVNPLRKVTLYDVALAAMTERECVQFVLDELDAGRSGWMMTLNLDHLRRLVLDTQYAGTAQHADLYVADGMPLLWASCILGTPLPERITGSNLVWNLSEAAALRARSIFLLGGNGNAAAHSAEILQKHYPRLKIAGVYAPPRGFEERASEMHELLAKVQRAKPDIVYVALGSPKEDNLIQDLKYLVPSAWYIGVGISLSWVAGQLPRAPLWMQNAGLEWLHRLYCEPRRLARRYLVDDLPFAAKLFWHAAQTRWKRAP
jgi:N-acetylglucosaminyldiphosphoundecaprenol N-acetyl-beta-D-mannosaminyltransferase